MTRLVKDGFEPVTTSIALEVVRLKADGFREEAVQARPQAPKPVTAAPLPAPPVAEPTEPDTPPKK